MVNNKRLIYIPVIFLFVLIIWIIYSINQPPNWSGRSDNGEWESDFTSINFSNPKGYWSGKLYSKHDEDVDIQKASLIKNSTVIHEWDGNETIRKNEHFEFLTTTQTLNNKKDSYVVNVSWKDTNGTHEDTITLNPKQRFLVIPNF